MNILFIDVETTGLPIDRNAPIEDLNNWPRIVEIAWLLFDEDEFLIEEKHYIIKPTNYNINNSNIHGITNETAIKKGTHITTVLSDLNTVLDKSNLIVAHNLDFDYNIILSEAKRYNLNLNIENIKKFCTQNDTIDYCNLTNLKYPKLSELYFKLFNKDIEEKHNALSDVWTCAYCFFELREIGKISYKIIQRTKYYERPIKYNLANKILKIPPSNIIEFKYCDRIHLIISNQKYSLYNHHGKEIFPPIYENLKRVEIINYHEYKWYSRDNERNKFNLITNQELVEVYVNYTNDDKTNAKNPNPLVVDYLLDESHNLIIKEDDRPTVTKHFLDATDEELFYSKSHNGSYKTNKTVTYAGVLFAKKGGKWGIVNYKNEIITPFIYDYIDTGFEYSDRHNEREFSSPNFCFNLLRVQIGNYFGFINIEGEEIIPCKYYYAENFTKEGYSLVSDTGISIFVINTTGEIITTFENPDFFSNHDI